MKNKHKKNMKIQKIAAVALKVRNMERACLFYSRIPGLRLSYGGSPDSIFTSFEMTDIGSGSRSHINLEFCCEFESNNFGRIIIYSEDVDKLYDLFKNDSIISKIIEFVDEPKDSNWGERYFHIIDPDGHELSFAEPIKKKN